MRAPGLSVYVGWDSREMVAFSVLAHSILKRATIPIAIVPLTRQSLGRLYTRRRGVTESTEFSLTRFLVPYLSGFTGHSLFLDCDMICRVDLLELWLHILASPGKAVYCCQHDYIPKSLIKFDDHEQTKYPRKNWSSFMVFDNAQCQALTPDFVNTASGLELHRFLWLGTEQDQAAKIGSLPLEWNWLVTEYESNADAKLYHFTEGTPCFEQYADCDHADLWWAEYADMLQPALATERALSLRRARPA